MTMIYRLLEAVIFGLGAGIIGSVYREILAYEKPFTRWWQFGARYEKKWFFRPVWECGKCFSGQLAGWAWIFCRIIPGIITARGPRDGFPGFWIYYATHAPLGLFCLILAITTAIASAIVLTKVFNNK